MTHDERSTLSQGVGQILEAFGSFQRAADDRYATKDDLASLSDKVDGLVTNVGVLTASVQETRRNAKGANNWSKITVALLGAIPTLAGVGKAMGLF